MSKPTDQRSHDLPNEVLLHAFSFLPLASLVIGRAVSKDWMRLIPLADIPPIRHALFEFYLTLVRSPFFPETRPWVLAHLQPFDRQAYIDALMRRHPYVPEAFRVWILEWPARAAIGRVWPGLPSVYYLKGRCLDDDHRVEGGNWLEPLSPTVCPIPFRLDCTSEAESVPALSIFQKGQASVWLILDERDAFRDRVYTFADMAGRDIRDEDRSTERDDIDADWIRWQQRMWRNMEAATVFLRRQLQARSWQQMDDQEGREAFHFDRIDNRLPDWGELVVVDPSLTRSTNYAT